MKIILNLTVHMNDRKITTIKAVREIFGMGLVEAKIYVETYDGLARSVIVNPEQLGRLYIVSAEFGSMQNGPIIYFDNARRFDIPLHQYDFSHINR
jgi:Ribosomal protein L7/L12 C-terminal domain